MAIELKLPSEKLLKSRTLLAFLMLSITTAQPAFARTSALCEDLRARLAGLPVVIGTNPEMRKYSNAITEQNLELRKVQNDLRSYGCGRGSIVTINGDNAESAAYCDELASSLARMQENIRYLSDMREQARSGSGVDAERRDLLTAIAKNGCNEQTGQADLNPDMNIDADADSRSIQTSTFIPPGGGFGAIGGNSGGYVSTVCVRTCDGGFFPLSANATPMDFQRDAATCARMCPGVQTELFYHVLPTQETTDMISTVTGAPYSQLPNAFIYRNRQPGEKSACGCNLSAYYDEMRQKAAIDTPSQGSITRIETIKPKQNTTTAAMTPIAPPADRPYDPSTTIRQVGPKFLADDQGTINLRNPATPGPQPQQ